MIRKPNEYVGKSHETSGSEFLAVVGSLTFPRAVLGDEIVDRVQAMTRESYHPIGELLELLEQLDARVGAAGLRKTGRAVFKASHEARLNGNLASARDVVYGIDGMYKRTNRGVGIGGWKVVSFEPGRARLEKTTPHHCALEEGILDAALQAVGVAANVTQPKCVRTGADHCVFEITSHETGAAWSGKAS